MAPKSKKAASAKKAEKAPKKGELRTAKGKEVSTEKFETREPQQWRGGFDFADDGGAEDVYPLRGDGEIPEGSVVFGGVVDVEVPFKTKESSPLPEGPTHADGVIAITLNAAGDLLAPSRAQFWSIGRKTLRPTDSGEAVIAGDSVPRLEIKGRDVIQGRCEVTLDYFEPGEEQLAAIEKRETDRVAAEKLTKEQNSEKAQKQKQADAIAAKIVAAL